MGKYTKMFESGDYDPGQLGATVHWVMRKSKEDLTGDEAKKYRQYLDMLNDGAHWVLEKNGGHGMPPGVPAKIMKLYEKEHGKTRSDRDKVVDKVKSSRKKSEQKEDNQGE